MRKALRLTVIVVLLAVLAVTVYAATTTVVSDFVADDSTVEMSGHTLRVKDRGIPAAKIALDGVDPNNIHADIAGTGLVQSGVGQLDVNVDDSTIEVNTDTLRVKDRGIPAAKIALDGVDPNNIHADVAGTGLVQSGVGQLDVNVDDSTLEVATNTVQLKDDGTTIAKLAAAVEDLLPNVSVTAGAESGDTRVITFQVRDGANNNLAERLVLRAWIATGDYGAPSATSNSVNTVQATTIQVVTAGAHFFIGTDANGTASFNLSVSGDANRYIMSEIDGRVYSSGLVSFVDGSQ